jgi:hypothetical protein
MIKDLTRGRLTPKNNNEYIPKKFNQYSTEDLNQRNKSKERMNKSLDINRRGSSESAFKKTNTNNNSRINYSENCNIL